MSGRSAIPSARATDHAGSSESVQPPVEKVGEDVGQRLVVPGLGDELLGEQRLPGSAPVDLVDPGRVWLDSGQQGQLLGRTVAGQRAQHELVHPGQPSNPREPVPDRGGHGRIVLAVGADQGQPRSGAQQVLEQVQGRRVGPVQVLDEHRERTRRSKRGQRRTDRREQPLTPPVIVRHRRCVAGLVELRQQPAQ